MSYRMVGGPMLFVIGLWTFLRALLFGSVTIALENLALRHQLGVLQRSASPPARSMGPDPLGLALTPVDRLALESCHRSARHRARLAPPRLPALLAMEVQETPCRPRLAAELRQLIRRMACDNPPWP
jgi:hypothetical protein